MILANVGGGPAFVARGIDADQLRAVWAAVQNAHPEYFRHR